MPAQSITALETPERGSSGRTISFGRGVRAPFALFVGTLVLIATGLITYSTLGIARNSDDPAAGAVVSGFAGALEQHDGKGACALLTPDAQSQVERDRKKPCEEGIVEVASDIEPHGDVTKIEVAERSGFVQTSSGTAFFVEKVGGDWKLSAAGCTRQAGDAPYSCELEA